VSPPLSFIVPPPSYIRLPSSDVSVCTAFPAFFDQLLPFLNRISRAKTLAAEC